MRRSRRLPESVLQHTDVDECVPLREVVPALLRSLSGERVA